MEIKLGEIIKNEVRKRNLSLTQLAEISNIPNSTLHDWSIGRLPSGKNIHYLYSLAQALSMSLEMLLFGQESKTTEQVLFTSEFVDEGRAYKMEIRRKG